MGGCFLGLFIETGRIRDRDGGRLKTALREVIAKYQPEVRLTPAHNLILANIAPRSGTKSPACSPNTGSRPSRAPGQLPASRLDGVRGAADVRPGAAESERYLPDLITRLEDLLAEVGLGGQEITIRMTGCPERLRAAVHGRDRVSSQGAGTLQVWLGGNEASTRLNRLYRDMVKDPDIITELRPLFARLTRRTGWPMSASATGSPVCCGRSSRARPANVITLGTALTR